jgi:hypothetical protein
MPQHEIFDPPIPPGEKALKRPEFARRVGVSPWTLQRYQREGRFLAFGHCAQGGRGRCTIYLESQITQFRKLPRRIEPSDFSHNALYSVEDAQQCFQAFDEGKSLRWCVLNVGIHPQIVEIIAGRYAALDLGIFIARPHVDDIEALQLDGPAHVKDGGDVLEILRRLRKQRDDAHNELAGWRKVKCVNCAKAEARYCAHCVKRAISEETAKIATKQAGAEAEAPAPAAVAPPSKVSSKWPGARAPRGRSATTPAAR